MMIKKIKNCCLFLLVALSVAACHHDPDDMGGRLSFSSSRVTFDTVFTTVGSVTKYFMVYNKTATDITADIFLAGGLASNFSINARSSTTTHNADTLKATGFNTYILYVNSSYNHIQP